MPITGEKTMKFTAYGITNELYLNQIAKNCSLKKKFTWEEPLILKEKSLEKILKRKVSDSEQIMIFAFGSVVFININPEDETKVIKYLEKYSTGIEIKLWEQYKEEYEIHIDKNQEFGFEDGYVLLPKDDKYYQEIIATIVAKSVALERTEETVEKILDNIEPMIDKLEKGKLKTSDKELAKAISKILRHEYSSLAYIMILDKPEITWDNNEANEFYEKASNFFELNERYKVLKEKTNILHNIMGGFTTIYHSTRGFLIEWVIVLLIVAEVILMILELFV